MEGVSFGKWFFFFFFNFIDWIFFFQMRDFVFVELDNCFGKLDFVWLDNDVVDFNKRDFILWTG